MDQLPTTRLSPNPLRLDYEEKHPKINLYTRLEENTTDIHDNIVQTCNTKHCYLINLYTGTILYGSPKEPKPNCNVNNVFYYSATDNTAIENLKKSLEDKDRLTEKYSIRRQNDRTELSNLYTQGVSAENAINDKLKVVLKNIIKATQYFSAHEVGDSDNDLSDSDTDETTYFTPEKAVRPKEVTLQGKNNDDSGNTRIKGGSLIRACHELSQKAVIKARRATLHKIHKIKLEERVSCHKLKNRAEYDLRKNSITKDKIIPDGYYLGQLIQFEDNKDKYCLRQISLIQNNEYTLKVLTLKTGHSPEALENFISTNEVHESKEEAAPNSIWIPINTMLNGIKNYEPKEVLEFKKQLLQGKLPNDSYVGQLILFSKEKIFCEVYQINCTNNQNPYIYKLDKLEFNRQSQFQALLEDFTQEKIEMTEENIQEIFNEYTPYLNNPISWLIHIGKWSHSQAKSEIESDASPDSSKEFTIGNNLKLSVKFGERSERMHLPDHFTVLGKGVGQKTDLSYGEIIEIFEHIRLKCKIYDEEFASLQLALLKFDNSVVNNIFAEIGVTEEQEKLEITNFIHFFNALIFGVEASRVNATLVTGVMTLELIKSEKLTYVDAFAANEYGGIFPLATLKSYSGNFAARRMLIESNVAGLKLDRQYPQWLAISLKEAKIVKLWAKHVLSHKLQEKDAISRKNKTEVINQLISTGIKDIFKEYYNIEFTIEDEAESLINSLQISDKIRFLS